MLYGLAGYTMPCRANRKYHNISEDESANMYIVIFVDKRGISFDEMFVEKTKKLVACFRALCCSGC